jgi:sterol desaturase/sphingolipid hydroxylase (fatty acid hydroxylase superfamily)
MLPTILLFVSVIAFLVLERVYPGRKLQNSSNWYLRVLFINLLQAGITFSTNAVWTGLFQSSNIFSLSEFKNPVFEGFICWFVGTFFFYWWHRIRHMKGFWVVFHQLHHSPQRIEALTSFYKHPIEILVNSVLAGSIIYGLLGASPIAILWYNLFATIGEFFYHSNIRTPNWIRYFIQTPELHSIHHQLDIHKFNFSDIPIWDRLFGTYKDTVEFMPACGFPRDNERKLLKILSFQDVYND